MYCKHCGKEINDEAIFCKHCGAKVEAGLATEDVSTKKAQTHKYDVTENIKAKNDDIALAESVDNDGKISNKSKIIIALVSVLSAIIIIVELLVGFGVIGHKSSNLYRDIIKKTDKIAFTLIENGNATKYIIENNPSSGVCSVTSLSRNMGKGYYSNSVTTNYQTEISQETLISLRTRLSEAELNEGQPMFESLCYEDGKLMVDIDDIDDSTVEIYITVERTSSGTSILEDGIKLSLKVSADEVSGECSDTFSFTEDGLYSVEQIFKELY